MKIELSFKDDAELRKYIKDMIKGQVRKLVREEIDQIIKDVHDNRMGKESMEHAINEEIKNVVRSYAKTEVSGWNFGKKVHDAIDKRISEYFEKNDIAKQIQKRLSSTTIRLGGLKQD